MKKPNKIAAASFMMMALLASCSDKGYWEQAPTEQGYSFQVNQYNGNLEQGQNEIFLTVGRAIAAGEETLELKFTLDKKSPTDITVPATVTFANGSDRADVVINIANAQSGTTYSGRLDLLAKPSYAGTDTIRLKCFVDYTWQSIGTGTFHDEFVMEDADPYPVEILKAENFGRYRVLKPYVEYYETLGEKDWENWYSDESPEYIEFWEIGDGRLAFYSWNTGLNYEGQANNPIACYPWYAFAPGTFNDSMDHWFEDEVGLAVLSPIYYIKGLGDYGQLQYSIQIELPNAIGRGKTVRTLK